MLELNPAWFLLLTLIGLVILAVFAYLKRQSYRLSRTLSQLYQLNQQLQQDTLLFLNQAWSLLKPIGISGYQARLNWFGEPIDIKQGEIIGKPHTTHLEQAEIQMELKFYNAKLSGERRYFAELVQQTFIHLVEHNLQTKINQVLTTQAGLQRAQVFAQHDLKNLMQFIQLLNSQLKKAEHPEQEQRILTSLKHSLPSLQQRAERILSQLYSQTSAADIEQPQPLQLAALIHSLAQPLFMPYHVQGDAKLNLPATLLNEAFYNLLANFRDHNKTDAPLKISIHQDHDVCLIRFQQTISAEQAEQLKQNLMRLFEPFWTNSKSGMGLGLYIARQRIQRLGGDVRCVPMDNQACFEVQLPIQK
ncbi:HAMP domain-containing histidine kinase [Thiomicrospira microaerophila]|uniref:sensor histidine kinase n=1 Tax=Thiomicrospira microaerophila TaxID=406020 RepID=UPI00200EC7EA|nr:HAMP domain-containing sensor histidine kinase [Thiomicrospira microaerophila]UQB43184.1 HAMP domain-containing histidine kinase [Thiomicrospira microaerophila]